VETHLSPGLVLAALTAIGVLRSAGKNDDNPEHFAPDLHVLLDSHLSVSVVSPCRFNGRMAE